jgi:hypothetical protein
MATSKEAAPIVWWLQAAANDTDIAFLDAHQRYRAHKAASVLAKYGMPYGPDNAALWHTYRIAPRRSWLLVFQLITGPDDERLDARDRLFQRDESDLLDALIGRRPPTANERSHKGTHRRLRERVDLCDLAVCTSGDEVFDDIVAHLVLPVTDALSFERRENSAQSVLAMQHPPDIEREHGPEVYCRHILLRLAARLSLVLAERQLLMNPQLRRSVSARRHGRY